MTSKIKFAFRLYVTGDAPNSVLAFQNLKALCQVHLTGRFEIEIVDLLRQPLRALEDDVLLTPTLIKFRPKPRARIIGNLNDSVMVLRAIGVEDVQK